MLFEIWIPARRNTRICFVEKYFWWPGWVKRWSASLIINYATLRFEADTRIVYVCLKKTKFPVYRACPSRQKDFKYSKLLID